MTEQNIATILKRLDELERQVKSIRSELKVEVQSESKTEFHSAQIKSREFRAQDEELAEKWLQVAKKKTTSRLLGFQDRDTNNWVWIVGIFELSGIRVDLPKEEFRLQFVHFKLTDSVFAIVKKAIESSNRNEQVARYKATKRDYETLEIELVES